MIKVLGLALYGPMAASTRYRLGQYCSALSQQGIKIEICHLLGDEYLRRRFTDRAIPWTLMLQSGWERLRELRRHHNFDVAILYGELFPLLPWAVERSLLTRPYIYDFDDAFYLKYKSGKLRLLRPLLGNKFDSMIEGAAAITAGNETLAAYARARNTNVQLLPTVVDTQRYVPDVRPPNGIFTVGWIGSPSTAPYLRELVAPLSLLGKEGSVRLIVIGGKAPSIPNVTVEEIAWSEADEITHINTFDVGVMPLPDDDWARGKCAFKLIQYMACAVPVIGSRVGANIDVVQADCGFLAKTGQDWLDALRFYRDQPQSGRQMGHAGRRRVEQQYSLRHNVPILAELIRKTVAQGK